MNFLQIANLVMQIVPAIFGALQTVQADSGKPWEQVVADVISHLTAGKPNAPALAPTANPADHPINS
jgi:hypothetical protein